MIDDNSYSLAFTEDASGTDDATTWLQNPTGSPLAIRVPASFAGTTLSIQGRFYNTESAMPVKYNNTQVAFTVAANEIHKILPEYVAGIPQIRFVSNASETGRSLIVGTVIL